MARRKQYDKDNRLHRVANRCRGVSIFGEVLTVQRQGVGDDYNSGCVWAGIGHTAVCCQTLSC